MPEIGWLRQYVPRTDCAERLVLAGINEEGVDTVVDELHQAWHVHAGLYRHRIGGLPGEDFALGGSLSVFACDVLPAAEMEWNTYYDAVHFPNVVRQRIYIGGARFALERAVHSDFGGLARKYLVVYELRAGVPATALDPATMAPESLAEYQDWVSRGRPFIENGVTFVADYEHGTPA